MATRLRQPLKTSISARSSSDSNPPRSASRYVPTLGLSASTPPTVAAFTLSGHVLGYARITGTARR
ncbi:hypothetical protein ACGFNX_15385 [Streptomyces sp. NPDC048723]|uniref:hypothetical protein n=1 Tax=Streptomyces sp. NPDC048723 TaxID=3365589 RepID=UPI0037236432